MIFYEAISPLNRLNLQTDEVYIFDKTINGRETSPSTCLNRQEPTCGIIVYSRVLEGRYQTPVMCLDRLHENHGWNQK
jgi:hypothetical protein